MRGAETIALQGVIHRYGTTTALADVSLSVADGEFFTLVGPSGCGKTTTLRLVGGFESPTAGTIRLNGTDVSGVPPEDRDVGVVFQNYALFPHMTVHQNVAYGLRFVDPPGGVSTDERVADLLSLVDMEGMGDRDPDQLSGGQTQRVALARALAPGPSVLLLDEPMSALDAALRERLRVELRELQQELDITTLYVTHDQAEALAISDRVAVMSDGHIEQVGTPEEIYDAPATRFVAEFVGDNNVFTGTVSTVSPAEETDGAGPTLADVAVGDTTFTIALDDRSVTVGDTLTLCVRPADLVVGGGTNQLSVTVSSTEFLGETTRVHLDWNGQSVVARTRAPIAETTVVGFEPADAHVVSVS